MICQWWFTYYIRDDVKLAQLVRARDCSSWGGRFVSGKNPQEPENSNLHGFELHRPSSKSTKLLLQVLKAIINQYQLAQDRVPFRIQSKMFCLLRICPSFACGAFLQQKKAHSLHVKSHIGHIFCHEKISSVRKIIWFVLMNMYT